MFWSTYDQYDPVDGLAKLSETPILFFHSEDDRVIPYSHLDLLMANHSGYQQGVVTAGRHTATFMTPSNRQILLDFMALKNCSGMQSNADEAL